MPHQGELGATSTMQSLCTSTFSANPKPGLGARGHGQILLDACLVRCGAITLHTALSPKDIRGRLEGYPGWKRGDLRATKTTYESNFCAHEYFIPARALKCHSP